MIPFAKAEIGIEEEQAVLEVLRSGWLTTGQKAQNFEYLLSHYLGGQPSVLAVSSATAGLHLALEACGIGPGDEVIIPTMTFTATAEVVKYLGAAPVLVDVDYDTWNIDTRKAEYKITNRTKAIIPVHFGGRPCYMHNIGVLARHYGLRVVEDAAHAFGSKYENGELVGSGQSDATVFSFYATKCITTGEGGAVATRRTDLLQRMSQMRLHGISRDVFDRYQSSAWEYDVVAPGFKYNMSDMAAAIGIEQLKKAVWMRDRRAEIASTYRHALEDCGAVLPRPCSGSSWHLYPIQVPNRNRFIDAMWERGIGCSVHFKPLHRMTAWKCDGFPVADDLFEHCVSLPIYSKMSFDDVDAVVAAVKECVKI